MNTPVLITGSSGRIGRVVCQALRDLSLPVTECDGDRSLFDITGWQDTIIHLAIDWKSPERTLEMTQHLLQNNPAKRFVLASSITVDAESAWWGKHNYLTAAKLAGESWALAWANQSAGTAIALRLGHFGTPAGTVSPEEEAIRITADDIFRFTQMSLTSGKPGKLLIIKAAPIFG